PGSRHSRECPYREGLGRDGGMTAEKPPPKRYATWSEIKHKKLQKVIRELHGLESEHLRSEPVRETFRDETAWEGVVEVFRVRGHPTAQLAYAWSHETDSGGHNYVAVLGIDPIRTASDAVRAAIAAQGAQGGSNID